MLTPLVLELEDLVEYRDWPGVYAVIKVPEDQSRVRLRQINPLSGTRANTTVDVCLTDVRLIGKGGVQ